MAYFSGPYSIYISCCPSQFQGSCPLYVDRSWSNACWANSYSFWVSKIETYGWVHTLHVYKFFVSGEKQQHFVRDFGNTSKNHDLNPMCEPRLRLPLHTVFRGICFFIQTIFNVHFFPSPVDPQKAPKVKKNTPTNSKVLFVVCFIFHYGLSANIWLQHIDSSITTESPVLHWTCRSMFTCIRNFCN